MRPPLLALLISAHAITRLMVDTSPTRQGSTHLFDTDTDTYTDTKVAPSSVPR